MASIVDKFTCTICYKFAAPKFESVLRHIGSVHSCEPSFHITCGIDGCPRTYRSYRSFRRHLRTNHVEVDCNTQRETNIFLGLDEDNLSICESQIKPKSYDVAVFLLKAKEQRRMSQSSLDGVITDIDELFGTQTHLLGKKIQDILASMSCSNDVKEAVETEVNGAAKHSLFSGLDTAYLQRKYYADNFHFVVSTIVTVLNCSYFFKLYRNQWNVNWGELQGLLPKEVVPV